MLDDILNIQNAGARVTMCGDLNDSPYAYFNPSIAYDGKGKLRINIRACTFAVHPHGAYYFRDGVQYSKTKNLYGYLDPVTLQVTDLKEVLYSADTPSEISTISGLEDARLFWRKDGMHFIGVQVDTRPAYRYPPQQAEFVYDEATNVLNYLRTVLGESPARGEKNWMPPDKPTAAFEFNYSPTEVYKSDRKVHGIRYGGYLHGSSQLLWQPKTKTYLAMLHSKHLDQLITGRVYDKMIYLHYFAEYNQDGILINLSQPFRFGNQDYIEFAGGMVETGSQLLASIGVGDGRMGFVSIDKDKAIAILKPYGGTESNPLPPLTRAQQRYIDYQFIHPERLPRQPRVPIP